MTTDEILEEIVRSGRTEEVLKALLDILIEQKQNYKECSAEYRSSLRAIGKINAATVKSDAISVLVEA